MDEQSILLALNSVLTQNLPLHYTKPVCDFEKVTFTDKDNGDTWAFRYEPIKGATTVLLACVNGQHTRGFENAEQIVSYFYALESAK